MTAANTVLVLFCKEPRLGYGKQRLAQELGIAGALRIARAMMLCALEDAAAWPGPLVVAPAAHAELPWAAELLRGKTVPARSVRLESQQAGNLGERLAEMDNRVRTRGGNRLLFMGSDAPALESRHFRAVVAALETCNVALADAADGGVTLMASADGWPDLSTLPWSTDRLGDALADACEASGRQVARIDGGFDVDFAADARRLIDVLARDARPARQALHNVLREVFGLEA